MFERLTSVLVKGSSNPRSAKFYTALQSVRYRFNIYAGSCVALATMMWRWAPQTRYTLRRYTVSIVKGLIGLWKFAVSKRSFQSKGCLNERSALGKILFYYLINFIILNGTNLNGTLLSTCSCTFAQVQHHLQSHNPAKQKKKTWSDNYYVNKQNEK